MSQREFVIGWLESNRSNGAFEGHQEENMDFESLDQKELNYYYQEWITDEEKQGFFEHSEDVQLLQNSLVEYMMNEFGDSEQDAIEVIGKIQYGDEIPIGYTVIGDEVEFDAQATLDMKKLSLEKEVSGGDIQHTEYRYFSSVQEMANEIDGMTLLGAVQLEKISIEELTDMSYNQNNLLFQNIQEVIGSAEYGENPYMVSERNGNFSRDVIVYGYDPDSALDNYVDHGESEYGWDSQEFDLEEFENPYMAKGYFPLEMNDVVIKELDQNRVERYVASQNKTLNEVKGRDDGLER